MLPARVGRASDKSASDVNNSISCFVTRKMNSYPFALFCHALYLAGSRVIFLRRVCVVILSLSLSLSLYIYIVFNHIVANQPCTCDVHESQMEAIDGKSRRRITITSSAFEDTRGERARLSRGGRDDASRRHRDIYLDRDN